MKANKFFAIALASITLALSACDKDKNEVVSPNASFYVVETTFDQAYTAGVGRILVSEEGFTVTTDADWLQAQKEGARAIVLTIAKNETAESRTANVIITKGDNVQRVPITQLGAVNTMTLSDINTQRQGGEYTFSTERMDTTPTVTVSDSWINYTLEGNELKIKVEPFAQGVTEDRVGTVTVQAGLFSRTIRVTQVFGVIAYEDIIGTYTATFIPYHNQPQSQIPLTIEEKEKGKSFTLKGLAADLTIRYNAQTGAIIIPTGLIAGATGLAAGETLVIGGWGCGIPDPDNGNKEDWGFNLDRDINTGNMVQIGTWNKNFEAPVFTFAPSGFGTAKRPGMLIFRSNADFGWVGFYTTGKNQSFSFYNLVITKQVQKMI